MHNATPRPMNIYERKLLQLRRLILSGESCGAAQEAIVPRDNVLDVFLDFIQKAARLVCRLPTSTAGSSCLFTAQQANGNELNYT
ncbi:Hypothetical predicted protein [Scomber scombrus]|uniref:Uncharacterized protein n=1 Tax=Scomber scombrus TaxID=13677 RepID=A0AAV1PLJ4_SCOSC